MILRNPRSLRAAGALALALLAAVAFAVSSVAAQAGTGAHAAAGTPPVAPSGVTGASGVDSAAISFTPSTTTTPPVTSYTVTAYPGKEQGFGATSPVTVTGLQPNAPYTFSVTAANAAGRSSGSAPSAAITTLPVPAGVTPAVLSGLHASLVSFFAAGSGGQGGRTGTDLSYTDSAAATSTFTVIRIRSGFKHAGGCVLAGAGKRCTSLVLLGTFTATDIAGANKIHFNGRIGGRGLPAGLYQVRITPSVGGVTGNTLKIALDIF